MLLTLIKTKFKSHLGRDAALTLVGQLTIMLCMLAINKIISNEFSVADFGRYNIIRRSSSVLSFIMLGGIGIALPRYLAIALTRQKVKDVKLTIYSSIIYIVTICSVTLIVYIICKPFICEIVVGDKKWNDYIVVFGYSFINCLGSFLIAYFRGLDRFKDFNLVQIIMQISLMVPFVFTMKSIVEIFFWWTIIQLILLMLFCLKEIVRYKRLLLIPIPIKRYFDKTKELTIYSIPRLIGDFLLFTMSVFPLLYIAETSTMDNVSYFSVSISLFTLTTPIFSVLGVILLPYISRLVAQNRMIDAKNLLRKILRYYIILALGINIIMFVCMKWMILIFFSADYFEALSPSRIISFALIPASLYYLYRNPIDALSVRPYNTYILCGSCILLVVGFFAADNLNQFAFVYLGVYVFQGLLSLATWNYITRHQPDSEDICS